MNISGEPAIRDIKVADLCQAAKVNKTTFYAYYKNVYELSEEVEKALIRKIITQTLQPLMKTWKQK